MANPKLELVDVEVAAANGQPVMEKRVKATTVLPDHVEYASKEQLTELKAQLTSKLAELDRRLAVFPK